MEQSESAVYLFGYLESRTKIAVWLVVLQVWARLEEDASVRIPRAQRRRKPRQTEVSLP